MALFLERVCQIATLKFCHKLDRWMTEGEPTTKGDCFSDLKTPLLQIRTTHLFFSVLLHTYIEGKGAGRPGRAVSRGDQRNPPLKLGVQRSTYFSFHD